MLQKQKENIFGFQSNDRDLLEFDKTATFFCPAKSYEKEASFSTTNTDATRETSEKSTPPQPTKAEPRKKVCTVKRVIPVQINNITKALNRKNLINLPLISTRINSAVDKSHREQQTSLTRNSSQQSLRKDLDISDSISVQRSVHQTPKAGIKNIVIHKRLPSDQSERRPYNLNQQVLTEPMLDDDNGFDLLLNTKLINKNTSKPRLKVTKVNRIKVISALPTTGERTRTEDTMSMLNSTGEEKGLRIETKIREMINSNVEDLKGSSRLYPMSTKARNHSALMLPEPLNTPISRLLSATPILGTDDELPLITPPSSTTFRRMNSSQNPSRPPLTLEPIKVYHDMQTPMREYVDSAIGSIRYPESTKNIKTEGLYSELNVNFALSPQQNGRFNVFSFNTKTSSSGRKESMDCQNNIQKKINIKFKNEEAVLNKLFKSVSIKKNE